ncbi:hypothetical protein AC249_AIPGENE21667 [Exaiptasia diaphana]|nr:hypothetical protein AC249_AIPGENE21667 [Exaiptasia diaphana]
METLRIAAIHNSPEFLLGKRLNANINQDFKPKSFQELYDILIQRKVYGAFIDGYAIGNHRDLFEHPSLKLSKIYDVKPAYGIVLAGNSSRLRRCFYRYIQGRRAEIFRRVAGIVQIIENHDEIPQIVHYSINLISSTTILFKNTVITLAVSLVILIIAGCVYEYYKDKSSQQLECKLRDIQELRHYVENFVKNMSDIEKHLRQKHAPSGRTLPEKSSS